MKRSPRSVVIMRSEPAFWDAGQRSWERDYGTLRRRRCAYCALGWSAPAIARSGYLNLGH